MKFCRVKFKILLVIKIWPNFFTEFANWRSLALRCFRDILNAESRLNAVKSSLDLLTQQFVDFFNNSSHAAAACFDDDTDDDDREDDNVDFQFKMTINAARDCKIESVCVQIILINMLPKPA